MLSRSSCLAVMWVLAIVSVSRGQVVQLPTFEFFTVNTTVVVPDRGAAYLGGVSRANYASSSYGVPGFSKLPGLSRLFTNRSSSSSVRSSNAWASARIIDLQEMDRSVLAAASGRTALAPADVARQRKALFLAQHIGRSSTAPSSALRPAITKPPDRGEYVRRTAEVSAREVFETAQRAETTGRLGAARCGYRRVERMAHGPLQAQAKARLAAMSNAASVSLAAAGAER